MARSIKTVENVTQASMKRKTSTSLIVLAVLYVIVFLPTPLDDWLKQQLGLVGRWAAPALAMTTITGLCSLLLFAQDPLATGVSSSAIFFRSQYPSESIRQHYRCSAQEARDLWFKIFDKWTDDQHPQYLEYVKTFERGYGCRFIYYVSRGLVIFLVLSFATLLANFAIQRAHPEWPQVYSGILILVAAVAVTLWLFSANRIPGRKQLRPTGCWWKWTETNENSRNWLQQNLFNRAATYQEAYRIATAQ